MSPYRRSGKVAEGADGDAPVVRAMVLVAVAMVVLLVALRPAAAPSPRAGGMAMPSHPVATLSIPH